MDDDKRSCAQCGVLHCRHLDSAWPSFCMTTRTPQEDFDYALGQYRDDPEASRMR